MLGGSTEGRAGRQAVLSAGLTLAAWAAARSSVAAGRLAGLLALQARSGGQSSNYAWLRRDRLLQAQASGQSSGSATLARGLQ